MKKIYFLLIVTVTILGGCSQQKSSKIEGAWQLVNWRHLVGDSLVWEFPGKTTGSNLVIYSEHLFLSVGRFKNDTAYIDNSVGATYILKGNRSEETLLYFPIKDMVGKKVKSLLEVRNDTLIKTYPLDANWKVDKSGYSVEKYIRFK